MRCQGPLRKTCYARHCPSPNPPLDKHKTIVQNICPLLTIIATITRNQEKKIGPAMYFTAYYFCQVGRLSSPSGVGSFLWPKKWPVYD